MERMETRPDQLNFQKLKIKKKQQITKTAFSLEFEIPLKLRTKYQFEAGQYVTLQFLHNNEIVHRDYSITSAPQENKISLAIDNGRSGSASQSLNINYSEGQHLEVSTPKGRFTIQKKPHEFRTIIAFATGIGITPILSHLKNILFTEPRTRLFLFYGNRFYADTAFKNELDALEKDHSFRLKIYYFYSQEEVENAFLKGRLDEKKLEIIINQYLHLDDTDEESTIWDAADEVLICGNGDMIKALANACYKHGIPKKNIHFELFDTYNEDIYPAEKPDVFYKNIEVEFILNQANYTAILKNNDEKLLPQLLELGYKIPYSCKSGICGSCECKLEYGKVDVLENEYLTEKEAANGSILPCMSMILSQKLKLNFDTV